VPEGFQFQADAQAVRAEMMGLRQALYASPRAASRAFRQAEATYTRLRARTERLGQGRDGPMINRVRAVGDVLNALRPALTGL
jgi:predicted aminopeptidase